MVEPMDCVEQNRSESVDYLAAVYDDLREKYTQKLMELDDLRKEMDMVMLAMGRLNEEMPGEKKEFIALMKKKQEA